MTDATFLLVSLDQGGPCVGTRHALYKLAITPHRSSLALVKDMFGLDRPLTHCITAAIGWKMPENVADYMTILRALLMLLHSIVALAFMVLLQDRATLSRGRGTKHSNVDLAPFILALPPLATMVLRPSVHSLFP